MKYNPHGCPIRYGLSIFGDKWSLLIIRDLMFKGRKNYGEFLEAGEGISTNILAARLVNLEERSIILKQPDPFHGKKFVYSLTEKGKALADVMLAIMDWAETFDEYTEVPKDFIDALRTDKDELKEQTLAALK